MLEELERAGALAQIQRVVGSSAGAISSMLISFRLSAAKTGSCPTPGLQQDPAKVADPATPQLQAAHKAFQAQLALQPHANNVSLEDFICLLRLFNKKGWYSSDYFYHWLKNVVASQFKDGRPDKKYTFADFAKPALHKTTSPSASST